MRVCQRKYISISRDKILDLNFIGRKIICKYLEEGKKAGFFLQTAMKVLKGNRGIALLIPVGPVVQSV